MKKTSFIKNLSLGVASIAAITPVAVLATSCANSKGITTTYVSFESLVKLDEETKQPSLKEMEDGHFKNDKILLGNKKFYKGNYILLVGSNAWEEETSTLQFFGGKNKQIREVERWFSTDPQRALFPESIWSHDVSAAYANLSKLDPDHEFGFVTFIDNFDKKFYDENGHEFKVFSSEMDTKECVGPFDKWDADLLAQSRIWNKDHLGYEFDKDEELTTDDYIRNDEQAKAYRSFINRAAAMFPVVEEKRTRTFDQDKGLMVIYKDGRLQEICDLPTDEVFEPKESDKDTKTLFGAINKYFTIEEEEEEK